MTIDAEGMLWVAMYDGWKVSQVHLVCKVQICKMQCYYYQTGGVCLVWHSVRPEIGLILQNETFDCTVEPRIMVTSLIITVILLSWPLFLFWGRQNATIHFLIRKPAHEVTHYNGQRPHSEIPTCIILCNFTTFTRPLKPVMLIFLMLILCDPVNTTN